MLQTSKIADLKMRKVRLSSKRGRMAERLERQLWLWTGFALLTFTVRVDDAADDTGRRALDWDDIPELLKRRSIPSLIRKFQCDCPDVFGRYYLKPEVEGDPESDKQFHVHALIEVRPHPDRPNWGAIQRPTINAMAAAWHPYGDLNVRPGAKTKDSIERVSRYFCKADGLVSGCYRDWGLRYHIVTPSRARPSLGIRPSAPLCDPRVRCRLDR